LNLQLDKYYQRNTWLYILAFCLVWWTVFSFSRHYLDGADMVENYAWGMEWQWGNNKHPPLFGWIVAVWFLLFPTTDWAYYLLNELNLGVALALLALAMKRVLPAEKVLAAIILTLLGSHFGPDSGYKYNANTALLPFVAGFVWSMLHALENRRYVWFLIAGVFAGAALLTKYYALVLFLAISLALFISLRPPLAGLFKGGTVCASTAVLLVSPHVFWSIQHAWPSLHYMHTAHEAVSEAIGSDAYTIAITGAILFSAIPLLVWGASLIRLRVLTSPRRPKLGLSILILGLIVTLLAAWGQHINPVSSWFIPALFFLGWALVDIAPNQSDATQFARRTTTAGIIYLTLSLIVATVWEIRYRSYPAPPPYALPQRLANDITRLYRETYHQDIQFVAGTFPIPYIMSFYSSDHPHGLYGVDLSQSPWINEHALKTGNKVVICGTFRFNASDDPACIPDALALFGKPDHVTRINYTVYDPKSKQPGRQSFDVLSWLPDNQHVPDLNTTRKQPNPVEIQN
jgi:4-amino-4-deoxy-L-arabinose transferase-like glycosyltransferase